MQTGLSYAQVFNPIEASQDSVPSAFYAILGVLLIFLTNLHHLMLRGLVDSYAVFVPGHLPPVEDLSQTIAHAVAASFRLSIEMAAPFIVLGTVFFVGLGLIARLVPQLQMLFITQPLQILGGLLLMGLLAATGMGWFLAGLRPAIPVSSSRAERWPKNKTAANKPKNHHNENCSKRASAARSHSRAKSTPGSC